MVMGIQEIESIITVGTVVLGLPKRREGWYELTKEQTLWKHIPTLTFMENENYKKLISVKLKSKTLTVPNLINQAV